MALVSSSMNSVLSYASLLEEIFSHLDLKSIKNVCLVSKFWRTSGERSKFWSRAIVNEEVSDDLFLLLGGTNGLDGLENLLDVISLHDRNDSLESSQLLWDFFVSKVLIVFQFSGNLLEFLNNLGLDLLSGELFCDFRDKRRCSGLFEVRFEDLSHFLS